MESPANEEIVDEETTSNGDDQINPTQTGVEPHEDEGAEKVESTPAVVMVNMRTKYWPGEVIMSTPESYEVVQQDGEVDCQED